ncbi:MAG: hypothetical protein QME66_01775 [Candidatus Eisenbacteria bacterium]|nr:hypothetical protein [Candidatus Eisenbacteria bacterium]
MSNVLRTTLIMLVLFCVILSFGTYRVFKKKAGEERALRKLENGKKTELAAVRSRIDSIPFLKTKVKEKEEELSRRSRILPSQNDPSTTYAYFNTLFGKRGAFLSADFSFQGKTDAEGYSYNTYRLGGDGDFLRFYYFIWYLENMPLLYGIESIRIDAIPPSQEDPRLGKVRFEVIIRAYYAPHSELPKPKVSPFLRPASISLNPFSPLVYELLPPNDEGLLDVDTASLLGTGKGVAFLKDASGDLFSLREGDRVYLGFVSKIDSDKGEVGFLLNKGGVTEKKSLRVEMLTSGSQKR